MCHLNIQSISRVSSKYILKLLLDNDIDVVLIQETHAHTSEDLRKKDRIRAKSNIEHVHLISTRAVNETDNVSIKLEKFTINNICKPPGDGMEPFWKPLDRQLGGEIIIWTIPLYLRMEETIHLDRCLVETHFATDNWNNPTKTHFLPSLLSNIYPPAIRRVLREQYTG